MLHTEEHLPTSWSYTDQLDIDPGFASNSAAAWRGITASRLPTSFRQLDACAHRRRPPGAACTDWVLSLPKKARDDFDQPRTWRPSGAVLVENGLEKTQQRFNLHSPRYLSSSAWCAEEDGAEKEREKGQPSCHHGGVGVCAVPP